MTPPDIVYIAGAGRSGSTVLDMMLGNLPGIANCGELWRLFDHARRGYTCSCGRPVGECAIWRRVLERLSSRVPDFSLHTAHRLTHRVQQHGAARRDRQAWVHLWREVIEAARHELGAPTIVDSSKTNRSTAFRIRELHKSCGYEVVAFHLVRDPRAVMYSMGRGSSRGGPEGVRVPRVGDHFRGLAGWALSNALAEKARESSPDIPFQVVRYEDLVADTTETFGRIALLVGARPDAVLERIRTGQALAAGHTVGGNRLRLRGPVRWRPDFSWETHLKPSARLAAASAWPIARRYGYDVLRQPTSITQTQRRST